MRLVIDTNIIISALIKEGEVRDFIVNSNFQFFAPSYTLSEITKHKNEICNKAKINSEDFYNLLEIIMSYIKIINIDCYRNFLQETKLLIEDINDVSFLALAIYLNCPVWSDDKHFKKQNRVKILTTKDMLLLK